MREPTTLPSRSKAGVTELSETFLTSKLKSWEQGFT